MDGEAATPPRRVAVIGGGITGLTAAYRLTVAARDQGRPLEVRLLEAGHRLGGVVGTTERDGYRLEWGPDGFLTQKPDLVDLSRELGIADQLVGTNPDTRRSFVAHGGRLHPIPAGFFLFVPAALGPLAASDLFSWPGKLRMAADLVLPRRSPAAGEEALAGFIRRRLGREAWERLAGPLVAGIYGTDPETLSLTAAMPNLARMERRHRSLILGVLANRRRAGLGVTSGPRYSLFASFREGMQTLVEAFREVLPAETVRTGARVTGLAPAGPAGGWRVHVRDASPVEADGVCLAVSAPAAARVLAGVEPVLARHLTAVPYGSSATVSLAYRREEVGHALDGMGFVAPARAGAVLACSFSSVKYAGRAPEGKVLLRAFVSEVLQPETYALSDEALVQAVARDCGRYLGITGTPLLTELRRHPRAMAQYTLGHPDRRAAIEDRLARIPSLALAGNYFQAVGLPDCVRTATTAARKLLDFLMSR